MSKFGCTTACHEAGLFKARLRDGSGDCCATYVVNCQLSNTYRNIKS